MNSPLLVTLLLKISLVGIVESQSYETSKSKKAVIFYVCAHRPYFLIPGHNQDDEHDLLNSGGDDDILKLVGDNNKINVN